MKIERLALNLPGLSADEGQRLARLVADGLTRAPLAASGAVVPVLRIDVARREHEGLDLLAQRIVAEVRRQMA